MTHSLKSLSELAKDVFKANPKESVLYATSDGQFFLKINRNAAEFHAKKAGGKIPLTIHTIEKEDKESETVKGEIKAEEKAEETVGKTDSEAETKKEVEPEAEEKVIKLKGKKK